MDSTLDKTPYDPSSYAKSSIAEITSSFPTDNEEKFTEINVFVPTGYVIPNDRNVETATNEDNIAMIKLRAARIFFPIPIKPSIGRNQYACNTDMGAYPRTNGE